MALCSTSRPFSERIYYCGQRREGLDTAPDISVEDEQSKSEDGKRYVTSWKRSIMIMSGNVSVVLNHEVLYNH